VTHGERRLSAIADGTLQSAFGVNIPDGRSELRDIVASAAVSTAVQGDHRMPALAWCVATASNLRCGDGDGFVGYSWHTVA